MKRGLEAATSLRDARRVFDLQLPHAEPAGGFRSERIGGVAGEWAGEGGATLLYLHGGAFFAGRRGITARSPPPSLRWDLASSRPPIGWRRAIPFRRRWTTRWRFARRWPSAAEW